MHLLSGPFPRLATLLHLVENHNAQNPLLSGFWAGEWRTTARRLEVRSKKAKVSLPLLLVLDSILGSGHIPSVASGPDRYSIQ